MGGVLKRIVAANVWFSVHCMRVSWPGVISLTGYPLTNDMELWDSISRPFLTHMTEPIVVVIYQRIILNCYIGWVFIIL